MSLTYREDWKGSAGTNTLIQGVSCRHVKLSWEAEVSHRPESELEAERLVRRDKAAGSRSDAHAAQARMYEE